ASAKIRHCLNQLTDEQVWWRPTPPQNSIANLILHLCGNVRQWIISGLGREPDIRNRPQEFAERGPVPRDELIGQLDDAVRQADAVLGTLTPEQLLAHCRIQGFDTTGLSAIFDSVGHFKGHTQEIICLSRMQLGEAYQFDWIPSTAEQRS
ncbi:MAG TPA: DUF1572 family protein, partial [Planctomycetaceae bacterium]|nr:DUF1572 family protein [Planctomycetaceae bacterium]